MFTDLNTRRGLMLILVLAVALTASASVAGHRHHHDDDDDDWDFHWGSRIGHDGFEIDLKDNDTIVVEYDDDDEYIEITEDYELYISGDRIKTDRQARKLLREYHTNAKVLCLSAEEIGKSGARIGMQGAKLGAVALVRLVKMLGRDYDSDDFEDDMEADAEQIEELAEDLEDRAEGLEDLADEMEDIAEQMCEEIPELEELGWF